MTIGLDPYEQRLEFGDVAGDGRDDYLVIDKATGAVDAYINEGGDRPDGTPGWSARKGFAKGTLEAARGVVIFGDVFGSDKDDYVVVDSTITPSLGVMYAWENTGGDRGNSPGWVPRGKIAQGVTRDVNTQFRLQRHDCDGKDDYWALYNNSGAVDVWINKGGDKPDGTPGWAPRGRTAAGVASAKNVRFGDVDGDGRPSQCRGAFVLCCAATCLWTVTWTSSEWGSEASCTNRPGVCLPRSTAVWPNRPVCWRGRAAPGRSW